MQHPSLSLLLLKHLQISIHLPNKRHGGLQILIDQSSILLLSILLERLWRHAPPKSPHDETQVVDARQAIMPHCHLPGIRPIFLLLPFAIAIVVIVLLGTTTAIHGIFQCHQVSLHEPFFSSVLEVVR